MQTIRLLARFQWPWLVDTRRPTSLTRPSTRRRAAVAIATGVVALALVHLGLAIAAEASLLIRDPVYADKERRLTRIERGATPGTPLVVLLGTSRTGYGFAAGRVPDATEGRIEAFNFGIPATGPVSHLIYLRRLIAAGHRPDLLILEILPPALAELKDGTLEGRFADGNRLRAEEAAAVISYGFPAERIQNQRRHSLLAPWHSFRFHLLGRVTPSWLPFNVRFDWGRSPDPRGWNAALAESVTPEQAATGFQQATREYAHILKDYCPENGGAVRALRDLLAMAREHGIPVRLLLMPESVAFRGLYPRIAQRRLDAVLAELSREFGCPIDDARGWVPDTGFLDGHHLTRDGAAIFTDRLTREVIVPTVGTAGGTR